MIKTREVPLSKGLVAMIDDEDYVLISKYKWHLNSNGYVRGYVNWKSPYVYMHRIIIGAGSDEQVDHINGKRLDNSRGNLRITSQQQNAFNMGLRKDSKSGYKGVRFRRDTKKWTVSITHNYKEISLGCYKNKHEAARAYNKKALELFGEYARLNEIKGEIC